MSNTPMYYVYGHARDIIEDEIWDIKPSDDSVDAILKGYLRRFATEVVEAIELDYDPEELMRLYRQT